jgi:hypothetical protein
MAAISYFKSFYSATADIFYLRRAGSITTAIHLI